MIPGCPTCGQPLAATLFLGTGAAGYYCVACRAWFDASLRAITSHP